MPTPKKVTIRIPAEMAEDLETLRQAIPGVNTIDDVAVVAIGTILAMIESANTGMPLGKLLGETADKYADSLPPKTSTKGPASHRRPTSK